MAEHEAPRNTLEKEDTHLTHASTRRTLERFETRPTQYASDVLDLPYDILSDEADMEEYTQETATGIIPKRTLSRVTGKVEDHELVTFTINDPENPKNWTKPYSMFSGKRMQLFVDQLTLLDRMVVHYGRCFHVFRGCFQ